MAGTVGHALGKRERLVGAARALLHRQGYARTTLADVAAEAGVPLGNVYYYYKTKEELVLAALADQARDAQAQLASFERAPDPGARLKAFARSAIDGCERTVRYGCPYGSLAQELAKEDVPPALAAAAASTLRLYVEWAATQFREWGADERTACDLAVDLYAARQGTSLLANTLRAPDLLERQAQRLEGRIDSVSVTRTPALPEASA